MAALAKNFKTSPWSVEVSGLVAKPGSYTMEDLVSKFKPEERIYRLRCVEAWSLVIPWVGFPISRLLQAGRTLFRCEICRVRNGNAAGRDAGTERLRLSLAIY